MAISFVSFNRRKPVQESCGKSRETKSQVLVISASGKAFP